MTIVVREAQLKDIKEITRLCQQLGYSTSTKEVSFSPSPRLLRDNIFLITASDRPYKNVNIREFCYFS